MGAGTRMKSSLAVASCAMSGLSMAGAIPASASSAAAAAATTFAPPYSALAYLLSNQTTTTWASIASPTDSANPYGNVAWSSLWEGYNVTAPPFTTTVQPTPVAATELIKPPALPWPTDSSVAGMDFPEGFHWGFATAALQVEGAVKEEGKTPTIAEVSLAFREDEPGGGSPDIANLNYYLYKQDIARLAAAGVKSYSFSISWARILPFAVPGSPINKQGIDHYDDLINTCIEYGVEPIATLNHFDSPLYYATNDSFAGWDHPEYIEGFLNYASIVMTHYADRIGTWITFNEPTVDGMRLHNWKSGYNIVMSHANVVHWYRNNIKGTGQFSLKLSLGAGAYPTPLDPSNEQDVAAAARYLDFAIGYMANPLYLGLPPPDSVMETLGSAAPVFTAEELEYAKGTCDFFAFDHYGSGYDTFPADYDSCLTDETNALWPVCVDYSAYKDGWLEGATGSGIIDWQLVRYMLSQLNSLYPSTYGIVMAEFGFGPWTDGTSIPPVDNLRNDISQSAFYSSTLNEVLKAIHLDGVKMSGAIGWTAVDNWEWGLYNQMYGVQGFNMTTLDRYYKRSIFDVVDLFEAHGAGV